MSARAATVARADSARAPEAPATAAHLRRLVGSAALYAGAALAQRALGFLLLPIYTRLIPPSEYGALEVLLVTASLASGLLTLGLASGINKVYHRDCDGPAERSAVLATALAIDLPLLVLGGTVLLWWAEPASAWLVGAPGAAVLFRLAVLGMLLFSVSSLVLALLRAEERALAFGLMSLVQFVTAAALNILFVVAFGMGVRGVLWGSLLANAVTVPVALVVALRGGNLHVARRLVRPLVAFGVYLVPVMLAGWAIDVSDRYFLRLYHGLDAVALYGVGYKIGMVVELLVVWPFQLAWPAYSFSIADREGHQATYARALTYLTLVLTFLVLALSVVAPVVMPRLVGPAYHDAHRIVPLVGIAYALNGIGYCVSPGVHLGGRTRLLAPLAALAALVNVGLNIVVLPSFGALGAAATTVAAFLIIAAGTGWIAQRVHPVAYEYARLARILAIGVLAWVVGAAWGGAGAWSDALRIAVPLTLFPLSLWLSGFLVADERAALAGLVARRRGGTPLAESVEG